MVSEIVIHRLDGSETVVHGSETLLEAPNWTPDGNDLIVNGGGRLFRLPADGGPLRPVETGFATACNNDHGLSPDGRLMAISDQSQTDGSCIYVLPATGGKPKRVTAHTPSWWHGWSPIGDRLAYTARRGERFCICTCNIDGGDETALIGDDGSHYDGPDYAADGKWIWFNSNRGGRMQLWRMRTDGTAAEAMTDDERSNWFPHPSPDGRHVVYLAFAAGVEGHPRDHDVELRLMPAEGGAPRSLSRLRGGQGTINVPSWAPDSTAFAYVRYPSTSQQ